MRRRPRVEPGGLELWTIVSEAVLHQEIGGPSALGEQLRDLHDTPGNLTVQILPFGVGAHAGLGSPFHLLRFADWPTMVYQETITKGLYRDDPESVRAHENVMEHVRAAALSPGSREPCWRSD